MPTTAARPGKKHERPIVLADWQQAVFEAHRATFCAASGKKKYAYPHYMFVNESADIMGLRQQALDRRGIAWRMNLRNSLSVARREAVAALDHHVGPKS
ncbi:MULTISPECIES: hypothetical protein [Micromonospora]|uniref:hypothetical protein n=1 Tax=Micromonospora TaxID=1873 RepID=UPI001F1149AE|nr:MULTISPECIES: hypothetical protein [Micromonospora]MDG4753179.1 hypothetical protein [Micromonospora sp. WMMD718]